MIADGKRYIVHPSRSDVFKLWNIADVHFGAAGCAKDLLSRKVAKIGEDPFSFWVGGGDYADYISLKDRRFDASTIDPSLKISDFGKLGRVLTSRVRNILRPIASKCLGLLFGNHEWYYMNEKDQQDLHSWLCTELDVSNLGYCGVFDLVFIRDPHVKVPMLVSKPPHGQGFSRKAFRVYLHHGAGAAQSHGGKINRLAKFMEDFEADIYMIAHVHDKKGMRKTPLGANRACRRIVQLNRIGTITGGFLRGYAEGAMPSYAERYGLTPTPLGAACVWITPETRELEARI